MIYIIGLLVVGIIWGITNPFMESGVGNKQQDLFGFKSFIQTILNYKFIIPFGINQSASIFYYYLLGHTPLSLGPVIVNCVNSATTVITESRLKKQKLKQKTWIGLILMFIGTYMVCSSK
ncbi:unnamed protein product [Paramecium primaurelia]|uniref:Transmembrane protein 234 n=2 Tax=Paramecium TaxID=5884 RepID=A0A8S1XN73_9CILI|nr:unnamed protein product [Paramecium primaurelia]CAD8202483.1 unnamed protein product [Paramecium pentaurelia]